MNNPHHCARTTYHSRVVMTHRVLIDKHPVRQVAHELSVSRQTFYKWIKRYQSSGDHSRHNRSSRPAESPSKLSDEFIDLISLLYKKFNMKSHIIAQRLKLAYSTVTKVLRGLKLTKKTAPRPQATRYEYEAAGDMIHMDIKKLARFQTPGHRVGQRTHANKGCGYEYVHVCIDDHSRWTYVEVFKDEKKETTLGFMQRSLQALNVLGVQVNRLLTDNGSAYRSKLVNKYLQAAGIKHMFTKPYTPRTSGKAERFIQTLCREWAYAHPYQTSIDRLKDLPEFLNRYNLLRPHSALGKLPPASRIQSLCQQRV